MIKLAVNRELERSRNMAFVPVYRVHIGGLDGVLRTWSIDMYVTEDAAQLYFAAADAAARAATSVGVLMTKAIAMQSGFVTEKSVTLAEINDAPVTNPGDSVLRGNKLNFGIHAGIKNSSFTIPCRATLSYTQKEDSLDCELDTPTPMSDFVAAYEAVGVNSYGDAATITRATVVD